MTGFPVTAFFMVVSFMLSIIPADNSLLEQARELAQKWGFKLSDTATDSYYLQLTRQHLQLVHSDAKASGPIYVDFTAGSIAHRRRFGGGKGQTIAKAVGLKKAPLPVILDATAGLGKDAFVFASLGARVIMMERSPVAAALLSDGLERATLDTEVCAIVQRMSLIVADTRLLTPDSPLIVNETPDVIYLDPMFPHRKKSARVKKEMQAFQDLVGNDTDSNELLAASRQLARKRVVVKRPITAQWLDNQKPSLTMKMKKHRFDIYLS